VTNKMHSTENLGESIMPDLGTGSGSVCADGIITNWIAGVIQSQYVGLLRSGVRIKVGKQADLRVRWALTNQRLFVIGQRVVATIPARAVRVECGIFRRSKQRWNRWIGRIVLVEHAEAGTMYTVKIHGEEWTIKSYGPVVGARQPSKPWDVVNVVVDPQSVDLSIAAPCVVFRNS
jgi:hypothetical protein